MNYHRLKLRAQNLLLTIKGYSFIPKRANKKAVIIIMFDNKMQHGGLLDRIKGIVSTKMIADELQYDFKIYVNKQTFNLFKFLGLKNLNIAAQKEELAYNIWTSKPVSFYNALNVTKEEVLNLFKNKRKQYHFYCNVDLHKAFYPTLTQEQLNKKWRHYFNQIFCFDDYFINAKQQLLNSKYITGFHLRFLSLLGDKTEGNNVLPEHQKAALVQACMQHLQAIINSSNADKFLIVSDSSVFLKQLKNSTLFQANNIIILEGSIAHIDFVHDEAVLQKAILDFYLLSQCAIVHQIVGDRMYNSQFCRYAAILGNAQYVVHKLKDKTM